MQASERMKDEAIVQNEDALLYCPLCSSRLVPRKCKMLCACCGYYMSCADYY